MYSLENFSGRDWGFIAHCEVPLPFFLLLLDLNGYVWIYISLHKPSLTQVDSLFFLPSRCFHMASCHNYSQLHMCIWLWCVAKDCPWLSNSTLTVIFILMHSMTEHVLGPYWWGCTASALSRSWGSVTRSLYLIWSIIEINMWFFFVCVCVCVKNWAKFCSEYVMEQGLLERSRHSWEYNIKMDL